MFASVDLARRIERAEARLSAEIARVVAQRRPSTGAFAHDIAGGVATYSGPGSPINKLIGIGFGASPDARALEVVEAMFDAKRERLQAEVASLAAPEWHSTLSGRGYVLQGFENVLGCAMPNEAPRSHDGVELVGDAEIPAWATMLMDGFEHPDAEGVTAEPPPPREVIEQIVGDMVGVPGLKRYTVREGGRMVSGAGMHVDAGVAQFTGSATIRDARRRGHQTRFIRARLADAAALGCDVAVVTTAPGTKSQENLQKQGFNLLYSRAILVRVPR